MATQVTACYYEAVCLYKPRENSVVCGIIPKHGGAAQRKAQLCAEEPLRNEISLIEIVSRTNETQHKL